MIKILPVGLYSFSILILLLIGALTSCAKPPSGAYSTATMPASNIEAPPLVTAEPGLRRIQRSGPVKLRPDHPQRYVVAPGDTLVEVVGVFFQQPWRWPEVWRPQPGAEAPEAIYPGEVIELYYEAGQPRLRPVAGIPTIKLSPQIRVQPIEAAVPTVPRQAVRSLLKESIVTTKATWNAAPSITANPDDRVILGIGERFYVTGFTEFDQRSYRVFHPGGQYRDPATGDVLGFIGYYVGEAVLQQPGDPAIFVLTDLRREARAGDRLFPVDEQRTEIYEFVPQIPPPDAQGYVVGVFGDSVVAGQYQTVVVNLGETEGMEPGYVLDIFSKDLVPEQNWGWLGFASPTWRRIGSLMLYDIYPDMSYGLVTDMTDAIRISDRVQAP